MDRDFAELEREFAKDPENELMLECWLAQALRIDDWSYVGKSKDYWKKRLSFKQKNGRIAKTLRAEGRLLLPILLAALSFNNILIRQNCVRLLLDFAGELKIVSSRLAWVFPQCSDIVKRELLTYFKTISNPSKSIVQTFHHTFNSEDWVLVTLALEGLRNCESCDERDTAALEMLMRASDEDVRDAALLTFNKLTKDESKRLAVLRRTFKDPNHWVRFHSVKEFGKIVRNREELLPKLLGLLTCEQSSLRSGARESLIAWEEEEPERGILREIIREGEPRHKHAIQELIIDFFGRLEHLKSECWEILKHPDRDVRCRCLTLLLYELDEKEESLVLVRRVLLGSDSVLRDSVSIELGYRPDTYRWIVEKLEKEVNGWFDKVGDKERFSLIIATIRIFGLLEGKQFDWIIHYGQSDREKKKRILRILKERGIKEKEVKRIKSALKLVSK